MCTNGNKRLVELLNVKFTIFCDEHGIRRGTYSTYTPQQNGVADWKNRTVVEMARSMLKAKELPDEF